MVLEKRERKGMLKTWTQDKELIGNNAHGKERTTLTTIKYGNVLSTSCTTIPLSESPTRETFESIQVVNVTDGILSLTAMNVVVPSRSTQSFALTGLEGFLASSVIFPLMGIVKTSHGALSALNSG